MGVADGDNARNEDIEGVEGAKVLVGGLRKPRTVIREPNDTSYTP